MPRLKKLGYRQFFRILQNLLGLRVLGLPHFGTPYNTRMVVRDIFVSGVCDPSKLRLLSLVGVKICDAFGIAFFSITTFQLAEAFCRKACSPTF